MLRALSICRSGQIWSDSTRPERGVDRIPHVVEPARAIELVRIDIERDARTRMTELAGRSDRVDASPDQVAREGMAKVVEPELRDVISVQAGCPGRVV